MLLRICSLCVIDVCKSSIVSEPMKWTYLSWDTLPTSDYILKQEKEYVCLFINLNSTAWLAFLTKLNGGNPQGFVLLFIDVAFVFPCYYFKCAVWPFQFSLHIDLRIAMQCGWFNGWLKGSLVRGVFEVSHNFTWIFKNFCFAVVKSLENSISPVNFISSSPAQHLLNNFMLWMNAEFKWT